MALPLPGQEPARLQVDRGTVLVPSGDAAGNQKLADSIAEHLRQSAQLRRYQIDVTVVDGTTELSGTVADQPQRDEVLRLVQGVPGVERVRDRLVLANAITPVQSLARGQESMPPPRPLVPPAVAAPGVIPEPVPIFQPAAAPGPYDLNPPLMPPYAWPTYAPYNNYSRVAYPEAYPYQSWPFIGPCYPFPKIPLGWRSIKLEWQDGHWWYSKVATGHDWWRLRYW
jgi:hypothetical protein